VPAQATDPFAALGDPNRRRILRLLADGNRSVGDLAAQLPISRPAVSRHLRLLREAGLVDERARGTQRIYALRDEGLAVVKLYLEEVWGVTATRFRMAATNLREPEPRQ
jgi:DNA-binding transcriptional ArsR family regulator